MGLEIKKLDNNEIDKLKVLIRLFEDVFEMENLTMPDNNYLQQLLEDDKFLVFVALLDGEVVGGLTSYILQQTYSKSPLVYIHDLGVKTDFQQKGIGKMLISDIKDYCKKRGIEEIFVQAEEEDHGAIKFYRSTGATAENIFHFSYPLNTS